MRHYQDQEGLRTLLHVSPKGRCIFLVNRDFLPALLRVFSSTLDMGSWVRNLPLDVLYVVLWDCHLSVSDPSLFLSGVQGPVCIAQALFVSSLVSDGPGISFSLEWEETQPWDHSLELEGHLSAYLPFTCSIPAPLLPAHFWNFLLLPAASEAAFRKAQTPHTEGQALLAALYLFFSFMGVEK